jgi:hypothetical protein
VQTLLYLVNATDLTELDQGIYVFVALRMAGVSSFGAGTAMSAKWQIARKMVLFPNSMGA